PHVVITPGGTTVVAWIDETDPSRTVRVAVLTPSGVLRGPVTLENGDGFGNVVLSAGRGDGAVAAWHVTVANEWRVRVARYQRGAWSSVATLSRSLYTLDHIAVAGRDGTLVRWLERDPGASTSCASKHVLGAPAGSWPGPPGPGTAEPYTYGRGTRDLRQRLPAKARVGVARRLDERRLGSHCRRARAPDSPFGPRGEPSRGRRGSPRV